MEPSGDGILSWLLPGGKGKFTSFLPLPSAEFPYFAFFVMSVEEGRPATKRMWDKLVVELTRDETIGVAEATKNVCEALEMPLVDVNNLPIYR